jgi:hypothetical protein
MRCVTLFSKRVFVALARAVFMLTYPTDPAKMSGKPQSSLDLFSESTDTETALSGDLNGPLIQPIENVQGVEGSPHVLANGAPSKSNPLSLGHFFNIHRDQPKGRFWRQIPVLPESIVGHKEELFGFIESST